MHVFRRLRSGVQAVPSGCVATIGVFDGVHLGHRRILDRVREQAAARDLPSLVFSFEPTPQEVMSPQQPPARLMRLREKFLALQSLGIDHLYCPPFEQHLQELSPEAFIEQLLVGLLGVRHLVVGDDFRFGARRGGDLAMLKQAAGRCGFEAHAMASVIVDGVRVSSTAVREALAAGDMRRAQRLLGRPYSISGRVVSGDRLGRKLGFPTANVLMKHNRPALSGIYAVEVHGLGAKPLPGAASLGVRPTVTSIPRPCLEVHLLDFDRDIYGAHLQVNFLHKLRDEEKYADVETLRRQIAVDVESVSKYFLTAKAQRREGCAT